jgi:hypothetical protein
VEHGIFAFALPGDAETMKEKYQILWRLQKIYDGSTGAFAEIVLLVVLTNSSCRKQRRLKSLRKLRHKSLTAVPRNLEYYCRKRD